MKNKCKCEWQTKNRTSCDDDVTYAVLNHKEIEVTEWMM
jgi:hypothetical protein